MHIVWTKDMSIYVSTATQGFHPYHGGVLWSTPLPALDSQHTIYWLYLNVSIQIANKLGNLKKNIRILWIPVTLRPEIHLDAYLF
jgi:hypothetical protein